MNVERLSEINRLNLVKSPLGEDERVCYIDFWNSMIYTEHFEIYGKLRRRGRIWMYSVQGKWHECSRDASRLLTARYKSFVKEVVKDIKRIE